MVKNKEFNEALEQQIGDAGGEPQVVNPTEEKGRGLGRLRHIPGQQDELTESDKVRKDDFEAKVAKARQRRAEIMDGGSGGEIRGGWIPIDRASLGFRSIFYPQGWEFRVRPANVEAIKNWSSIDEENLAVVNNVMNEIVKTCVSIYDNSTMTNIPWDKMNSWDRFWFILKVREYTFAHGEQALEFDEECDECGANVHFTLTPDSLFYEFPDESVVEKHWNAEQRFWDIDPREYDVNYHKVRFFVPTLQKDAAILRWLYLKNEAGKQVDEVFVKFLPFMLERAPKDNALLDKMIKECHNEFKNWDTETFLFFDEVRRNITLNPTEKLITKCDNCGEEVRSTVRFPNGIKYLFAIQGRHKKFGSK